MEMANTHVSKSVDANSGKNGDPRVSASQDAEHDVEKGAATIVEAEADKEHFSSTQETEPLTTLTKDADSSVDKETVDAADATKTDEEENDTFVRSIINASVKRKREEAKVDNDAPFVFPNLFREAHAFVESSLLIYAFTDLRQLARDGKIENPDAVLTLPISFLDMLQVLCANRTIITEAWGPQDTQLLVDIMDDVEKELQDNAVRKGIKDYGELEPSELGVVAFGDDNPDEECVYCIGVNSIDRHINVCFRGTVTYQDIKQDVRMIMDYLPNPLADEDDSQREFVRVHSGFADYMWNTSKKDKGFRLKGGLGGAKLFREGTKCQEILDKVIALLKERPGYKLYSSGHSLGGALSSLFAFEAAACGDPAIPYPVTCVSIASPKVGNAGFRHAHNYLEKKGRLRYLRVENTLDSIPLLPARGVFCSCFMLCAPNLVYHTHGIILRLHQGKKGFDVVFKKNHRWPLNLIFDIFSSLNLLWFTLFYSFVLCKKALQYHNCREYSNRLKTSRRELKDLHLNDFYEQVKRGQHGRLHRERALLTLP